MKKLLFLLFISTILFINSSEALELDEITVDIKGAVNFPGVYNLKYSTRVSELITLAGGLRSDADTSLINLSKVLNDEDVVIIYTVDEILDMRKGSTSVKIVDKECMCPKIDNVSCIKQKPNINLININTASKEELEKLEGIGSSKADSIINYRKENPFTSIEDIMKVKGIGKTIYEKIKDHIRV